jgi:DNA-binding protein YbaB
MYADNRLQEMLRAQGIIAENEVVSKEGDLYVAVNVINNSRRIVNIDKTLLEGRDQKQLLKG